MWLEEINANSYLSEYYLENSLQLKLQTRWSKAGMVFGSIIARELVSMKNSRRNLTRYIKNNWWKNLNTFQGRRGKKILFYKFDILLKYTQIKYKQVEQLSEQEYMGWAISSVKAFATLRLAEIHRSRAIKNEDSLRKWTQQSRRGTIMIWLLHFDLYQTSRSAQLLG